MKRLKWPVEIKAPGVVLDVELVYMYHQLREESMRLYMKAAEYMAIFDRSGIQELIEGPSDIISFARFNQEAKAVEQMAAMIARRVNVLPRGPLDV